MIVAVKPSLLEAILKHIFSEPERAVINWREMMETHEREPCLQCHYDAMIGRRCCCLCLESNLLHAQFVDDTTLPVKKAHDDVKVHREQVCGGCMR